MTALELLEHTFDAPERFAENRQQRAVSASPTKAARQPLEEGGTQPLFEHADLLADGSLRHAQFERRAREAQMARRRLEGT
jgi:hypothetical protein